MAVAVAGRRKRPGKPIHNSTGDKERKNYTVEIRRLKGGRPTGLTADIQEVIVMALESGAFIETAITLAGVPKATFYDWLKYAKADEKAGKETIYTEFADSVKIALAVAESKYLGIIGQAASEVWQAAAWMLERRFRNKWAKENEKTRSDSPSSTPSTGSQTT